MEIIEYETRPSNSYGVYEFDWNGGHKTIHHGSWGVCKVGGIKNYVEKSEVSFTELPEIIQDYANKHLDLPVDLREKQGEKE